VGQKHQVRMPVSIAIAEVAILRHHVAHRADFWGGQFAFVECGPDGFGDLCLGFSANASLVFAIIRGRYVRAAGALKQIGDRIPGFQNSGSSIPAAQDRCTIQTNPFVPRTAVW
jgi:hypothetical protein